MRSSDSSVLAVLGSEAQSQMQPRQHDLQSEDEWKEGEWNVSQEMAQLQDDVLHEQERVTADTIATFSETSHSSSEFDPTLRHMDSIHPHHIESSESLNDGSEPSSLDDLYDNTDTEDGGYDIVELLDSNRKLIAFLVKQRTTISRLRARIDRMRDLISILNTHVDSTTRDNISIQFGNLWHEISRSLQTNEFATVLWDNGCDTSFLIQPNQ